MSISRQSVLETLAEKGFKCTNIQEYKTLDTVLQLECKDGHKICADFRTARDNRFYCPICEGKNSLGTLIFQKEPPTKTGKRIVAIDNATKNAGVAVFDNGKLVHYMLQEFSGELIDRLLANRNFIRDVVINKWHADLIVLEDIQLQKNVQIFKTLSMLRGSTMVAIRECGIGCEVVPSTTWRAHFMIKGDRIAEKAQAIDKVMSMYGVKVVDDIADAILLGKYAADASKITKLF